MARADKLRQTESDRENTPKDIADRDEHSPFTGSVCPGTEEEGRKGRCGGAHDQHTGDDGRILADFRIDKGVEPLVFHVPADLTGKSETPDKKPHFKAGKTVFTFLKFSFHFVFLLIGTLYSTAGELTREKR